MKLLLIALLLANIACAFKEPHSFHSPGPDQQSFDWTSIPTSEDLDYSPCYDRFECSRLYVPLDWKNSSSPHNISLAIIRLPAKVPETNDKHGGTIITNPGGPGGSGVQQAIRLAERLQDLLDGPKHYEILSFDPRGIFHSKPNAYCFDSAVEAEIWGEEKRAVGSLDSGDYALKYQWAAERAHGQLCANTGNGRFDDGENLRQHMSTASVARDMLEIIKKVDQRKRMLKISQRHTQEPLQADTSKATEKLQYFGTSYGTFLGQVFAAMYPQHVLRMVLDANLDVDNWMSKYEASVDDTAAIREYFFEACLNAGSKCALFRPHDKESADIRARYDALIEALDESPSFISGNGRATPITRSDVQQGFLTTSYQPLWFFHKYAEFLNRIISGLHPGPPFWHLPIPTRETFSDPFLVNTYLGGEVGPATHCSDGPDLSGEDLSGFRAYLANLTSRFGWTGGLQAAYKIPCWTWPASLRTKWRYDGPFNSTVPILFVNNRLDPVTPLKSAVKMSARFNSSVVLEQDSVGHGSLWPASPCMWDHVKRYVDSGILPSPGTVCEPLCRPFQKACEGIDMSNFVAWL